MAHETINITLTRQWARSQATLESDGSVTSVGGLAQRASGIALKTSPTASASVPEKNLNLILAPAPKKD